MTRSSLALGLALATACVGAQAAGSVVPATQYDCVGRELTVHYTTAAAGDPTVVITLGAQVIKARGHDVLIQPSVLGSLVTVRNGSVPDSHSDTLTLTAPDVNVPAIPNKLPTQFFGEVHFTRTFTTVGGPALVPGVVQQSYAQPVNCTATAPSAQASM